MPLDKKHITCEIWCPYSAVADSASFQECNIVIESVVPEVLKDPLGQRFQTFLTRGALLRINSYGGAPCLPYVLQVNGA